MVTPAREECLPRLNDGELAAYTWPGGYPIYYICEDNGCIFTACVDCARKVDKGSDGARVIKADIHWREYDLYRRDDYLCCDKCAEPIECAYI